MREMMQLEQYTHTSLRPKRRLHLPPAGCGTRFTSSMIPIVNTVSTSRLPCWRLYTCVQHKICNCPVSKTAHYIENEKTKMPQRNSTIMNNSYWSGWTEMLTCPIFVVSWRRRVSGCVFPTVGSPLHNMHMSDRNEWHVEPQDRPEAGIPFSLKWTNQGWFLEDMYVFLSKNLMLMLCTSASATCTRITPSGKISTSVTCISLPVITIG